MVEHWQVSASQNKVNWCNMVQLNLYTMSTMDECGIWTVVTTIQKWLPDTHAVSTIPTIWSKPFPTRVMLKLVSNGPHPEVCPRSSQGNLQKNKSPAISESYNECKAPVTAVALFRTNSWPHGALQSLSPQTHSFHADESWFPTPADSVQEPVWLQGRLWPRPGGLPLAENPNPQLKSQLLHLAVTKNVQSYGIAKSGCLWT